ncbi:DUF2917 domain-containing protein [Paraburkholderia sp. J12]|uniref:DUF2917 domain-containing protein n=1 Tax=Paraburkholderia sp. J12 TaxID=2805432 RepID=UPI002ABDB00E|nr:DUF2917 domain-containing protein [Paraburkholderia sp. J12]
MREIRIFELEHQEPVQTWRLAQPLQLHVSEGELWLTMEGDSGDYWLRKGESFELAGGTAVHLSAGQAGARFVLALGGVTAAARPVEAQGFAAALAGVVREWAGRAGWRTRAAAQIRA